MTFPPLAVTVDLVLMSVVDASFAPCCKGAKQNPSGVTWPCPAASWVSMRGLEQVARRILTDKAGFAAGEGGWLE